MSAGSPGGVRRLSYHPPAPYPSVTHVRPPTAIISQVPPSGVRTIPRGEYIARQHLGLMPSSFAGHGYGGAQALSYHPPQQMQAQLGATGQMFLSPRTGGGPSGGAYMLSMHLNSHYPIVRPIYPPGSGETYPLPPNFGVPLAPPSVDPTRAYTQLNWQANLPRPSQPSLPYMEDLSGFSHNTAVPPPPQPVSLGSPEPPLPTPPPSTRNETRPERTRTATVLCPFPQCPKKFKKYGRTQDLKRHVHQHLPHYIYCSQQGCGWTGIRRYQLRGHLKKEHGDAPFPEEQRMFIIYDAERLVDLLLKKEVMVALAKNEACMLHQRKAIQLGKLGSWRFL